MSNTELSIAEFQRLNHNRCIEQTGRPPEHLGPAYYHLMLEEEIQELKASILNASKIDGKDHDPVAHELGDVLVVLSQVADAASVDLAEAAANAFNAKSRKWGSEFFAGEEAQ
jgi:NTP pyrophosphatase (non-canonical NTP hydrolase)